VLDPPCVVVPLALRQRRDDTARAERIHQVREPSGAERPPRLERLLERARPVGGLDRGAEGFQHGRAIFACLDAQLAGDACVALEEQARHAACS
jgi:hypothetical protein